MKKKSSPVPAFASSIQEGMLLRDYFAGIALKAVYRRHHDESPDKLSRRAYELASAMMVQRYAPSADQPPC